MKKGKAEESELRPAQGGMAGAFLGEKAPEQRDS